MRRLLPKTRMGAATLILAALWLLKTLAISPEARRSLPPVVLFFLDAIGLLLVVPVIYYAWRASSRIRRKLLWKIRRRLVLAHTFIGLIPVLLIIMILWISALLFYYQFTYYLIVNQIGIHAAQLHAFDLSLSAGLQQAASRSNLAPAGFRSLLEQDAKYLLGTYPAASTIVRVWDTAAGRRYVYSAGNARSDQLQNYQDPPAWAEGREFSGLVIEDLQPEIYHQSADSGQDSARERLYLRSLVFGELRPDLVFTIESSVPFDGYLLDRLKAATGQDLLLADIIQSSGLSVMLQDTNMLRENILASTFDGEEPQQSVSRPVWSILLYPVSWVAGVEKDQIASQVLFVELSTSKLAQNLFRSEGNVGATILAVLRIVVGFFLVVEIVSLLIGVLLTKSITGAVHSLYRGTEFVRRGDFSHRIVVKSEDQLGALARSFNQMTEYVQALVKERVQKERLERELEIAKEVQEQLFPRSAPRLRRMELTGLCLPARVVSGDYYDFLQFDEHVVGLALGDICGKGISAALLMANLQATLRSNVIHLASRDGDGLTPALRAADSVSRIVGILNQQIYHYTADNKFASLFYAVWDDARAALTYCNAGHNPPLFFSDNGYARLETGGTVVGIFPNADYEQETIQLKTGDLILAYTDGIVESVNEYGEEFGEERLIRIIQQNRHRRASEIQKALVDQVLDWTYEQERDDDMTLIIGRVS
ncbi:MAG: PP2C family protein-serine/threonine phosphatase [Acidobacteriota bacterium]